MTDGQKNSLLGTLTALEQIHTQITRAARDGQSPAGSGRLLTPLPQANWRAFEEGLDRVRGDARDLAERFAGDALREREAREPVGATLYWIAFLLRRLDEEVISDLSPGQMVKFGALPEGERAALVGTVERIRGEIAALRGQVEALRQNKRSG